MLKRNLKGIIEKLNIKPDKEKDTGEKIYKTKSEWVKNALVNKSMYEKKYKDSLETTTIFGQKKEKNYLD